MKRKGLIFNVLRNIKHENDGTLSCHDCTNYGVTRLADTVLVVGHNPFNGKDFPEIFDEHGKRPVMELIVYSSFPNHVYARPVDIGKKVWVMFGGNFIYTSDSRGTPHPIPVHDRIE